MSKSTSKKQKVVGSRQKLSTSKRQDKPALDLSSNIMSSIKQDKLKMHSKWYFVALSAVSVTSVFLTSLLAAIFINLTVRDIDYAEDFGLRGFGQSGQDEFLASFPWILVGLAIIAISSTVLLARKLEFAYKYRGHLYFGAALGLIAAFGLGINVLGLTPHFEDTRPLRALQTLKDKTEKRVLVGEIISIEREYLELETIDGRVIKVEVDEDVNYLGQQDELEIGDEVGVFGAQLDGGVWEAEAIGRKPHRGPRIKGLNHDDAPPIHMRF